MSVDYIRPEVSEKLAEWAKIRACLSGPTAIRAGKTTYLPMPNPTDTSAENLARYDQYIARAVWYGVTGRTHKGMVGQAFQKAPVLELPSVLEVMRKDVDGAGVPLLQQSARVLGLVLGYGRCGMLTDYPRTEGATSRKEQIAGLVRPAILVYEPQTIVNWTVAKVGAKSVLTMVVLQEEHEAQAAEDDPFKRETATQYRVLALVDGLYHVEVWRSTGTGDGTAFEPVPELSVDPVDSSRKRLTEIPFTFVGSENNDSTIDLAPMAEIAELNVGHWHNSADYEQSCYQVGQPTPWASGLTESWVKANFPGNKVQLGSSSFIPLPVGGACGLMQPAPNSQPKEAMELKERQMVALGAKLIEPSARQRTWGEARLEHASEISVLGTCCNNVTDAYLANLRWAGIFAGTNEAAQFEMFPDAELSRMTPEELQKLMELWQGKAIADSELRSNLKKAGVATLDDDGWKEEVASNPGFAEQDMGDDEQVTPQRTQQQAQASEEQR